MGKTTNEHLCKYCVWYYLDDKECGLDIDEAVSMSQNDTCEYWNGATLDSTLCIANDEYIIAREHSDCNRFCYELNNSHDAFFHVAFAMEVARRNIVEALKKQMPQKPEKIEDSGIRYTDSYKCPSCGKDFSGTGIADFCYHCGQALDWEGVSKTDSAKMRQCNHDNYVIESE